jgi:hypothetical protein
MCHSRKVVCTKCGGDHPFQRHDQHCDTCKNKTKGQICVPCCSNCGGPHFADSNECPFFKARNDMNAIRNLWAQCRADNADRLQALHATSKKPNKPLPRSSGATIKIPPRPPVRDNEGFTTVTRARRSALAPPPAPTPATRIDDDEPKGPYVPGVATASIFSTHILNALVNRASRMAEDPVDDNDEVDNPNNKETNDTLYGDSDMDKLPPTC